jgi:hypothetical protein
MNELLAAFEAAIRRIVQEEMAKKSRDEDFGEFIDRNADKFDRAVFEGLENSDRFQRMLEDKMSDVDKTVIEGIIEDYDMDAKIDERIDNYDFGDKMTEAARELTFEVRVS